MLTRLSRISWVRALYLRCRYCPQRVKGSGLAFGMRLDVVKEKLRKVGGAEVGK
jgi:hypothetical protein